jgi:hypothetical protein
MQGDDVRIKYSYNGDANLDGMINFDDYFRIDSAYLEQPANPAYEQGDFNYDGSINFDDYFLIDSTFLGQGEPLSHANSIAATAEAEPPIFAGETTSITMKRNGSRPRPSADLFSMMRIARKTVRRAGRA